jgi:hypothetical protein
MFLRSGADSSQTPESFQHRVDPHSSKSRGT